MGIIHLLQHCSTFTMSHSPSLFFLSLKALLCASLSLNLSSFLFFFFFSSSPSPPSPPHAFLSASSHALLASSHPCSDHGSLPIELLGRHLDPPLSLACECHECFTGPACQHTLPDCRPNMDGGDPLLFEPYWKQNAEASAVLIPGSYRMGYEFNQPLIPTLESEIRALHSLVGNAVTEGRHILIGAGATQLILTAFLGLSSDAQGLPVKVVVPTPYYEGYRIQIEMLKPGGAKWAESSDSFPFMEGYSNGLPIEVVTSPNNPDGSLRERVLPGTESRSIHDHAYYWPHYTAITGPSDQDLMIFTLSKVTGHAGSRIGWAIIKDFSLYTSMLLWVRLHSISVSHESQLRATQLLRTVRYGYASSGNPPLNKLPAEYATKQLLFHYGHTKLGSRWDTLIKVLERSDRFSIQQDLEQKHCNFFKYVIRSAPAFAWIRCEKEEEEDCVSLFEKAGIIGRGGKRSGVDGRYVRLAMMSTDFSFKNFINRLQALVSEH